MIKMENTVYVVTMHRWADEESHNYTLGAFSTPEIADEEGLKEMTNRGNKYGYRITPCEIDKLKVGTEKIKWND